MQARTRLIALSGCAVAAGLIGWALQASDTEPIDSFARCAADGNPVSDTNPPICRYESHVFRGPTYVPAVTQVTSPDPLSTVDFQLLVQGNSGGTYPRRQLVINNEDAWAKYWAEVHARLPTLPPLLPVNFADSNVIALTEGVQQTDGYNLKITGISASTAGTTVDVTESVPTVTCQVMYTPTDRYYVARTASLREPVSFRITTQHRRCDAAGLLDTGY